MNNAPPDNPAWVSPFESLLDDPGIALGASPIQPAPLVSGDPATDVGFFPGQQDHQDTCAIRCQEFILERYTGVEFPEEALMRQAMDHGWYSPGGGTQMQDVGNLLELNGIPVSRYEGANVFNLANELAQGHKVIIGVDSSELWEDHPIRAAIADSLGLSGADHAVVVSGIDTRDPDHIQVIVSDPGTGEAAATYPLDRFLDAWQDSGCYMVATQTPAPAVYNPEMAHFDYDLGHIGEVAGLPYGEFLGFEDHPEDLAGMLDDQAWDGSDGAIATGGDGLFDSDLAQDAEHHWAWDGPEHDPGEELADDADHSTTEDWDHDTEPV